MSLNKICKHCGEVNNFGALFCDNCGEQLYTKKKFENFTSEELVKYKSKKTRWSFSLMILFLQSFFALYPTYIFLILLFQVEIIAYSLVLILVIICILSISFGIKFIFDMNGISFYLNLKDKASRIRYSHSMEHFNAGKFRKVSKGTLQELHFKFQQFDDEINKLRSSFKKYFRRGDLFLFLFILTFTTCLPFNFYYRNFFLSITTAITLALFFIYPIQFYLQGLNEQQQQMTIFTQNVDSKDLDDFIYYIEAIGLKTGSKNAIICLIVFILIVVIVFLNMAINYDLPISP